MLTRCISLFISFVFACSSCKEDKTSYNFEPVSIIINYTFICGFISDPVVMRIIYLTFNLRTVLDRGSNSAGGKNTSFCNSCLQP